MIINSPVPLNTAHIYRFLLVLSLTLVTACSEDTMNKELEDDPIMATTTDTMVDNDTLADDTPTATDDMNGSPKCKNVSDYIFQEKDGLLKVEFENADFSEDWKLQSEGTDFSGEGYMVWDGPQHLENPGNGLASFTLNIKNPGTYQFIWKSAVKMGDNGSDHNDTWLRFNDADDFYAQKENSIVYPRNTGKTPNPAGSSKDGWFKIYRFGNDLGFKWLSKTFDHNSHDIFVVFETEGIYTMEISARSSGHAIDAFVLYKDMQEEVAIANTFEASTIRCD